MHVAPQPDPAQGVFETLLVARGNPVELDAHLRRLARSARELFGAELPGDMVEEAIAAARGIELGRLRLDVFPETPGRMGHTVRAAEDDPGIVFPPWERGAALRSIAAEGWKGAHKCVDRGWLEEVEGKLGDEVPLLVDHEGFALEASRANVFAAIDGALATPRAEGHILPGTARAATLALALELGIEAQERRLSLSELLEADEVFLTSSVRGVRPVRRIDGIDLRRRGRLAERLATELRRRWLGPGA